jgi:hypothetical protein
VQRGVASTQEHDAERAARPAAAAPLDRRLDVGTIVRRPHRLMIARRRPAAIDRRFELGTFVADLAG